MFQAGAPPVRDTHLYFTGGSVLGAIRQGDWKLFLSDPTQPKAKQAKAAKTAKGEKPKAAAPTSPLFNLADDPTESTDVAAEHPDVVAKLRAEAQRREQEIKDHRRPAGEVQGS
jgi:arylsulfatase A-like enzyme